MLAIADVLEVPFLSEGQIKRTIQSGFLEQEEQKEMEKVIDNSLKDALQKPSSPQKQPMKNPSQQQQGGQSLGRPNLGYREEDVKKLTDLSFPREAAIRALRATNGDVEKAAALLFAESGNFF